AASRLPADGRPAGGCSLGWPPGGGKPPRLAAVAARPAGQDVGLASHVAAVLLAVAGPPEDKPSRRAGRPAAAPRRALAVATRAAAPCRHRAVARRRPGDPCPLAPWWLACAAALAARARCWLQPQGPAHRPLL